MLSRLRELRRDLGLMEIVVGIALGYAVSALAGAISASFIDFWRFKPFEAEGATGVALEGLFSDGYTLQIGERVFELGRIYAALLQGVLILLAALLLWRPGEDSRR